MTDSKNNFEKAAGDSRTSLFGELAYFLANNKKWWLLPILIVIGLLGVLAALGGSGLAPFIYTMF